MSAPKVTVLSGKRASITVAQELRYPESYGDIEASPPGLRLQVVVRAVRFRNLCCSGHTAGLRHSQCRC